MGGLVAAARLRELGREVVVLEKGSRLGGSMLLSSCIIWRHRRLEDFRAECPGGDPELQRLLHERLDDALAWLEALGGPVVARETGNPRTTGVRFEPRALTEALVRAAGDVRLGEPLGERADVLATGGWGGRLARERGLPLRANPWSDGAGLAFALARGAERSSGADEFYGRAMPAPPARWGEADFVRAAQLYGRWARVVADDGRLVFDREPAWHENDLVQAIAREPRGSAWYVVDDEALGRRVRERTVADMVAVAEELGGEVRREAGETRVRVQAAVTHTLGGLRVDTRGRVAGVEGLWACGADAGGFFAGGYGSGLAAALVLGLAVAEDVAGAS
jgi:succinate dehydrogenase/fumarate reductase flavoprotein subunit